MILLISMTSVASAEESGDDIAPPGMVKVEQIDLVSPKPPERDFKLRPYAERRGDWGAIVGAAYSTYNPLNYMSAFLAQDFNTVYGTANQPLIELQVVVKRNFKIGSIGIELAGGYYQTNSATTLIDSSLSFTEGRVGAILILDTLFSQPYVAPYASVGAYLMNWSEQMGSNTFNGNTQLAPYFTLGVQATLDWIDKDGARLAYTEGGIQSTFVFLEVRSYMVSTNKTDEDFSANFAPTGGLRLEF